MAASKVFTTDLYDLGLDISSDNFTEDLLKHFLADLVTQVNEAFTKLGQTLANLPKGGVERIDDQRSLAHAGYELEVSIIGTVERSLPEPEVKAFLDAVYQTATALLRVVIGS